MRIIQFFRGEQMPLSPAPGTTRPVERGQRELQARHEDDLLRRADFAHRASPEGAVSTARHP